MQETKPTELPKEIEDLVVIAQSCPASLRSAIRTAYRLGRMDGMLAFAKIGTAQVAPVSEVAA
jgi:hypothetical protein